MVYSGHVTGEKKWKWISNVIVYSIPLPMIYLLFWDVALKPHIAFNSAPLGVWRKHVYETV